MSTTEPRWVGAAVLLLVALLARLSPAQIAGQTSLAQEGGGQGGGGQGGGGQIGPRSIEITLVGAVNQDATLGDRIRSLFDLETKVEVHQASQLISSAVLNPGDSEKLYVWVTLNPDGRARVYVAACGQKGRSTRYLFREVRLESGLDEVGAEILAEIAHSSSVALWWQRQQISKQRVIEELAREAAAPAIAPSAVSPAAARAAPQLQPGAVPSGPRTEPGHPGVELVASVHYAAHASGDEGWLLGPGISLSLERGWSLRVGAAYVQPHHFDAGLAHLRLNGISTEARVGWKLGRAAFGGPRLHLELGLGALSVSWHADAQPPATPKAGETNHRAYALSSVGAELPLGPIGIGARLELRLPFHHTSYEIVDSGQPISVASSWISPGVGIEVRFPITHWARESTHAY